MPWAKLAFSAKIKDFTIAIASFKSRKKGLFFFFNKKRYNWAMKNKLSDDVLCIFGILDSESSSDTSGTKNE